MIGNHLLNVDNALCLHCGQCVNDCLARALKMDDSGVAWSEGGAGRCLGCQHCFAVCPVGAISLDNASAATAPDTSGAATPEMLLKTIQLRRSVRQFKAADVPPETLLKLADMSRWIPTAVNDHRLNFGVVADRAVMDEIRRLAYDLMFKLYRENRLPKSLQASAHYVQRAIDTGYDVFFRTAPHLVMVSSPLNAPGESIDPIIALSYFELYAASLGVGCCWAGLVSRMVMALPEFRARLGITEEYGFTYAMLFGLPDVTYARAPEPRPVTFRFIK